MPRIDQLGYVAALQQARPGLMRAFGRSVHDAGWMAVVMVPAYRSVLLDTPYATPEGILYRDYTPALRRADAAWVDQLRAAAAGPLASSVVQAHTSEAYLSLRFGAPMAGPGTTYKVFLGFDAFSGRLDVAGMVALGERLHAAGLAGAMKVDLRPGATRFRYNQLVLYFSTPEDAGCAESVAVAHFGSGLVHVGRGLDLPPEPGERRLDWHSHLLQHGADGLGATERAFVTETEPVVAGACGT